MVREPIVQGKFYPETTDKLSQFIEGTGLGSASKMSVRGIIVPHAGYVYSGKVAVSTIAKVLPRRKVIILGPNHTGYGESFALWQSGSWRIPQGSINIDTELADRIMQTCPMVRPDTIAHQYEHSIEVVLPILNHFFGLFTLVPIACQLTNASELLEFGDKLAFALKQNSEEVLLVASTDMTHYEPEASARKKDRDAIDCILDLDPEKLIACTKKMNITMCGVAPVTIFLQCLKQLGAAKAQVALYETSGQASKDYGSVVGYAGILVQ